MSTDTPEAAARAALTTALTGRRANTRAVLELDVNTLIDGGGVNTAKVAAWVRDNSTPKPTGDIPSRFRTQPEAGVDVGIAEAERRFGPKN
ncbi:hypothetical protein [Microbacterium sp. NPDC089696]|uniref:hypothetical protein n=1 Tax=Microbacterium sp. NPDC089696 TaxID=3364199 RepID=UPI00381367EF